MWNGQNGRYEMMKRTKMIGLSLLLFAGMLPAQEHANVKKWSLQECIDYAKEHNLEVRMQQMNVQQQEVTLSTVRSKRLPDLSASALLRAMIIPIKTKTPVQPTGLFLPAFRFSRAFGLRMRRR